MASKQIVDNTTNTLADTVEVIFTAGTKPVVIEAITAANTSTVNAAYSFYIKSASGAQQPQVQDKIVVWGENDLGIGVTNQVIPALGTISTKATAANSIYFTITGRELDS